MVQGWTKKQRMLVVVPITACLLIIWIYVLARIFINEENLELRGIAIKAKVVSKEDAHYKNGSVSGRYEIIYLYGGRVYHNHFQTGEYNFSVGDSIQVKIDSKNPEAYCEVAY